MMPIRTSALALEVTNAPVRVHKRRRWMSSRYHERIQKKWLKRFGKVMKPCMFIVQPRLAGLWGPDHILCHPSLERDLRAALQAQAAPSYRREWGLISVQDACV